MQRTDEELYQARMSLTDEMRAAYDGNVVIGGVVE